MLFTFDDGFAAIGEQGLVSFDGSGSNSAGSGSSSSTTAWDHIVPILKRRIRYR